MLELEQTQKKITSKIAAGENCRVTIKKESSLIYKKLIANRKLNTNIYRIKIVLLLLLLLVLLLLLLLLLLCVSVLSSTFILLLLLLLLVFVYYLVSFIRFIHI